MAIPPWDRYAVIVGMTDILARSETPSVGVAAKVELRWKQRSHGIERLKGGVSN
jgi:hypothetical protein